MGSIDDAKGYKIQFEILPPTSFCSQINQRFSECLKPSLGISWASTPTGQVQRILFNRIHITKTQWGYLSYSGPKIPNQIPSDFKTVYRNSQTQLLHLWDKRNTGHSVKDNHFQFVALKIGLSCAPREFTKCPYTSSCPSKFNTSMIQGIQVTSYLDGLLLKDSSSFQLSANAMLQAFSWMINFQASAL